MKVSCIIPAYNEEARISHVLDMVTTNPLIDEVIVVDDASVDKTVEKIKAFPMVTLIEHENNKGKSSAIYSGLCVSTGEFIVFVDADLAGLTQQNLTDLVSPVTGGEADVSISLRGNTPLLWRWIGLDYLSGERAMAKKLVVEHMHKIQSLPGFALEVFLNKIFIQAQCRIRIVQWPTVQSPYKKGGVGIIKNIKGNTHMAMQVLKNISLWEAVLQIWDMRKLRV